MMMDHTEADAGVYARQRIILWLLRLEHFKDHTSQWLNRHVPRSSKQKKYAGNSNHENRMMIHNLDQIGKWNVGHT